MELPAVLWALYALQCLLWLPGGAELFVRPLRGWWIARGPGWRLLHPLPSGPSFVGRRLPPGAGPAASLSLAGFREAQDRVARATRWLRPASDLYAVALLVLLPLAMLALGEERALWLAAPVLGALHVVTLGLFARAHRTLRPGGTGALAEALFSAALYPPLLLRAHAALRGRELASFHPAVLAAALLPRDEARRALRAGLVRAQARAGEPGAEAPERAALRALVRELGESPASLFAPPPHRDPTAAAYCPACHGDYRAVGASCTDCGVRVAAYGAA